MKTISVFILITLSLASFAQGKPNKQASSNTNITQGCIRIADGGVECGESVSIKSESGTLGCIRIADGGTKCGESVSTKSESGTLGCKSTADGGAECGESVSTKSESGTLGCIRTADGGAKCGESVSTKSESGTQGCIRTADGGAECGKSVPVFKSFICSRIDNVTVECDDGIYKKSAGTIEDIRSVVEKVKYKKKGSSSEVTGGTKQ